MTSPYGSLWGRLVARVSEAEHPAGCWIGVDRTACRCGYQQVEVYVPGMYEHNRRRQGYVKLMAHVAAWVWQAAECHTANDLFLAYQELRASGLELDHTCETPACRNPAHLEPLTRTEHRQRTLDRRAAGRDTGNYEHDAHEVDF